MTPERKKKIFHNQNLFLKKQKKYGNEIQLSNKFPLNLKKKNLKKRVNSFNFFLTLLSLLTSWPKKKLKENIIRLELLFTPFSPVV